MSLLNDALRDLENRKTNREDSSAAQGYGNLVAISSESSRKSLILFGFILVCLIAGATFWWLTKPIDSPQSDTVPQQGIVDRKATMKSEITSSPNQKVISPKVDQPNTMKQLPVMQTAKTTLPRIQVVEKTKSESNMVAQTALSATSLGPKALPKVVSAPADSLSQKKTVKSSKKSEKVELKEQKPQETISHRVNSTARLATMSKPIDLKTQETKVQVDTAKAHLKKTIRLTPEQIDAKNAITAQRLYVKGDETQANVLLYDFIQHQQVNHKSISLLVRHFIQQGRLNEASAILTPSRVANSPSFKLLKARIFVLQGKPRTALALLQQSAGTTADNLDYQAFLAYLYQQEGDFKAAVKTYGRLLEHQPEHADWWVGLGISLNGISDKANALRSYKKALNLPGLNSRLRAYAQAQVRRLAPETSSVLE